MFLLGASFAFYVVTPLAMQFFLGFADAASMISTFVGSLAESDAVPAEPVKDKGIDIVFNGKVMTLRSLSGDPTACVIDCQGSAAAPHCAPR